MSGGPAEINSPQTSSYFEPESRLQLVDKVRHLIRFSDFLLVLTGESGVGKSTLLQQISPSSVDNSVHSCLVSATSNLSIGALLSGLLAQLPSHANFPDNDQGRLEALNEQVKVTRAQGQRLLLLVDDADLLSDDALALLINLQLSNNNNDGTAPQLLLLGKPVLMERLERDSWLEALAGRVHHLSLAPFNNDEMQEFIRQSSPVAQSMADKQLKSMAESSGGFPGRLNQASVKTAQKSAPTPPPSAPTTTGRKAFPLPPIHMAGIAVLLIVITVAAAWTFSPENEPAMTVDNGGSRVQVPLSLSVPGKANDDGAPAALKLEERLRAQEARQSERTPIVLRKAEPVDRRQNAVTSDEQEPNVTMPESAVVAVEEKLAVTAPSAMPGSAVSAPKTSFESKPVQAVVTKAVADNTRPVEIKPLVDKPVAVPVVVVAEDSSKTKVKDEQKTPEVVQIADKPQAINVDARESVKTPALKEVVVLKSKIKPSEGPLVVDRSVPVEETETPSASVPEVVETQRPTVVKQDKVPRTARILADEKVLLMQPASNYTLQLLGAREKESIERFLQTYRGLDGLKSFATLFKSKPWYVVVYGSFSTRKQATAAVKKLPERLKKQRPWARSMKGIHSDINKR